MISSDELIPKMDSLTRSYWNIISANLSIQLDYVNSQIERISQGEK